MKFFLAPALLTAAAGIAVTAAVDTAAGNHALPAGHPAADRSDDDYHHHHHFVAGTDIVKEEELVAPSQRRRIPTSYESAVLARRILNLTPFGTVSTVFPADGVFALDSADHAHSWEARPSGLGGIPIGLTEYVAACEGGKNGGNTPESAAAAGNPTLLAIRIATTFRNAKAGSNVSLTLQWTPPPPRAPRRSLWPSRRLQAVFRGAGKEDEATAAAAMASSYAALPRFSLIGYFEPISGQELPISSVAQCFTRTHPDAKWWLPGNPVHESGWVRLVVTQVYWVGGFGDRAYIGWIPVEEWRDVTRAEWEQVRLPGEHDDAEL